MDVLPLFRALIHSTTPIPGVGPRVVLNVFRFPPPRTIRLEGEELRTWASRRSQEVQARRPVAVHTWSVAQRRRRVLLVHGWAMNARLWMRHVQALRARGVEVVAMDLPGHGDSGGRRADAERFVQALHAVLDVVGPVDALVGHSAGAATLSGVLVDSAAGPARRIPRLVTLGAPADVDAMFAYFQTKLGLRDASRELVERAFVERFGTEVRDAKVGRGLAASGARVLLVHDEDDASIPITNLDRLLRDAGDAAADFEVMRTQGLGHQGVVQDPAVVERVTDFIAGE